MAQFVYNESFTDINELDNSASYEIQKSGKTKLIILISICAVALLGIGFLIGFLIGSPNSNTQAPATYNDNHFNVVNPPSSSVPDDDNRLSTIISKIQHTVVAIEPKSSQHSYASSVSHGSGVIISEHRVSSERFGYNILTNAHVVASEISSIPSKTITVRLSDGTSYSASVVGFDEKCDVAVLRIEEKSRVLPIASIARDGYELLDEVIAISHPIRDRGVSAIPGVISQLDKEFFFRSKLPMNFFQINISLENSSSGGGVFNKDGCLIGIINCLPDNNESSTLSYALPASDALKKCSDILEFGYVKDVPTLGVIFAEYYDGTIRVLTVEDGYETALKVGDKIIEVNGVTVNSTNEIYSAISSSDIGDKLTFKIIRSKNEQEILTEVFEYNPTISSENN
jgi:serine protease Do